MATSISRGGQVVGHYQGTVDGRSVYPAFVWSKAGGVERIGDTGSSLDYTWATGVNDAGHVVGWHTRPQSGFVWSTVGGIVYIPGSNQANAINDLDQVVGEAVDAGGEPVAFVVAPGSKMVLLPRPDGASGSCTATDINALGQIVGRCQWPESATDDHAILWWPEAGTYTAVDLNAQLAIDDRKLHKSCAALDDSGNGSIDYTAVATNAAGQILVQVDCIYQFDASTQVIGFDSLILTPRVAGGA